MSIYITLCINALRGLEQTAHYKFRLRILHPKRKVWEQVMPDLRVDVSQIATCKGVPWKLRNSPDAVIRAPTVVDAQIS
ncbi:unnamed protein product [Taenia asiatica]|uniref:Fibronectin type-III domain-containing protein n=1 Tax=Taenia asiatica TaxID=60517 RepID=A0A0R3WG67_TAEAS|nr:unnamed protein product [Taenia asiatica]